MMDPDFVQRVAYMSAGGLAIYYGVQYFGVCMAAILALVGVV